MRHPPELLPLQPVGCRPVHGGHVARRSHRALCSAKDATTTPSCGRAGREAPQQVLLPLQGGDMHSRPQPHHRRLPGRLPPRQRQQDPRLRLPLHPLATVKELQAPCVARVRRHVDCFIHHLPPTLPAPLHDPLRALPRQDLLRAVPGARHHEPHVRQGDAQFHLAHHGQGGLVAVQRRLAPDDRPVRPDRLLRRGHLLAGRGYDGRQICEGH